MGPPLRSLCPTPIRRCSAKHPKKLPNLPGGTSLKGSPLISRSVHLVSEQIWTSDPKVKTYHGLQIDRADLAAVLDDKDPRASRIVFQDKESEDQGPLAAGVVRHFTSLSHTNQTNHMSGKTSKKTPKLSWRHISLGIPTNIAVGPLGFRADLNIGPNGE